MGEIVGSPTLYLWYGVPLSLVRNVPNVDLKANDWQQQLHAVQATVFYESEPAYPLRLGLLSDTEREQLTDKDYEPVSWPVIMRPWFELP